MKYVKLIIFGILCMYQGLFALKILNRSEIPYRVRIPIGDGNNLITDIIAPGDSAIVQLPRPLIHPRFYLAPYIYPTPDSARGEILALLMAKHPRLGVGSPAGILSLEEFKSIYDILIAPGLAPEKIIFLPQLTEHLRPIMLYNRDTIEIDSYGKVKKSK